MFTDMAVYYDAAKLEMAQASRKATEGWRSRYAQPKGQKVWTAVLASLVAFLAH